MKRPLDKIFTIEQILQALPCNTFIERFQAHSKADINNRIRGVSLAKNLLLRGIKVAMYIVGQERRLVDPPSQVVAGVRTVTTQMDERCDAHVAALIPFFRFSFPLFQR